MGKLNVAKMANFMEVDVYVVITCPECSLVDSQVAIVCSIYHKHSSLPNVECYTFLLYWFNVDDSDLITLQDFYKPVVTPFEMELACSR